jgi:nitrate/nitrite transport system substrate-binding protein
VTVLAASYLARRVEKRHLKIGFSPLTDCASVVMAYELGLYRKYGLEVTLSREPSWASTRDRLLLGELDAAHALYAMIYGLHLGVGGPRKKMAILMGLNFNGQAITLSRDLIARGAHDGVSLKALIDREGRQLTFAQTFPTGTHGLWLNYWLAAHGIDPHQDVHIVVVPPSRMVESLIAGRIDGFCAGEPWNARAIDAGAGMTVITSQAIWPDHPEKVLGTTQDFARRHPHCAQALVMALLEASRFVEAPDNRAEVADVLARRAYVDTPGPSILDRFRGWYEDGWGHSWQDSHPLAFYAEGEVTYPRPSHGIWFLTQLYRWGLLPSEPDYAAVAEEVTRNDLYESAAKALEVPIPAAPARLERFFDGGVFDPAAPQAYLKSFALRRLRTEEA